MSKKKPNKKETQKIKKTYKLGTKYYKNAEQEPKKDQN